MLCPAGKRWSTACAYLHPALSRPNLTAETQTFVSRVLFEGTRAVGVEYLKNGESHRVRELPPGLSSSLGREGVGSDPEVTVSVGGQESCSCLRQHGDEERVAGSNSLKDCPQAWQEAVAWQKGGNPSLATGR